MSSGGSEKTVTKSVNEPFAEQKPYLTDLYARAQKRSAVPLQQFPYDTFANRDWATTAGSNQNNALAIQWSPYTQGAGQLVGDMFAGKYLTPDSNPYLSQMYGAAAQDVTQNYQRAVMPGIASRYGAAGRVGGPDQMRAEGIAQQGLAQELSQLGANIYGGEYDAERNRQMQALQMAPSLEESRFTAGHELQRSGLLKEDYDQRVIDSWVKKFEAQRDEPDLRLARYAGLLGNPVTGSGVSSTSTSQGSDNLGQALQAAAAIASIFANS